MTIDTERLRQDITFSASLQGQPFEFISTWGIFSPREIDEGTLLLLKHMQISGSDDCLDIGCGYGPVGLSMAAQAPQGQTLMVDKDFMAIEYSRKNIQRNNILNASAQLSNGLQHIDAARQFDVVASNIPAKVGKELLTLMLCDARDRLRENGRIYVVTINGLRQFMKRYLDEIFGNYKKIKQGKTYTVAMATRP